jgi:hypothetical protein
MWSLKIPFIQFGLINSTHSSFENSKEDVDCIRDATKFNDLRLAMVFDASTTEITNGTSYRVDIIGLFHNFSKQQLETLRNFIN